jgi:hypothetical protein
MQGELMATLISVYPFEIRESKPCIYPGYFYIPAAKDKPESLIIGEAFHFVDRVDAEPLRIRVLPQELAQSIVDDWYSANLGVVVEEGIGPGLFWVEGAHAHDKIERAFADKIQSARARQKLWFRNLVKIADDDWARYHRHTVISDIQRHAVKDLGLDRTWTIQVKEVQALKVCLACQSQIDSKAIVCPTCRVVLDVTKFKELQLVQA